MPTLSPGTYVTYSIPTYTRADRSKIVVGVVVTPLEAQAKNPGTSLDPTYTFVRFLNDPDEYLGRDADLDWGSDNAFRALTPAEYGEFVAAQISVPSVTGAGSVAQDPNIVRLNEVPLNDALAILAAAHQASITFRYAKGDGRIIEDRSLDAESINTSKDGSRSIVGTDPDRDGEVRAYRVDRIKGTINFAD